MISVADLFTAPTSDEVRATLVQNLVTEGVPADQWRKGGVASTLLTVISITIAGFASLLALLISSGFLPTAVQNWLKLMAIFIFGTTPRGATFASGQLTLVNGSGGIYSFGANQAIFSSSATKKQYTNDAPFTLGASSSLTINITATESGSASTAAPTQIDTLVTTMLGVVCQNLAAVVGLDPETDEEIRIDCTNARGRQSVRGPRTAFYFYATHDVNGLPLNNSLGNPVNINRVFVNEASHIGVVFTYLASPQGVPSTVDVTAATNSIEANARPNGVQSFVLPVVGVLYTPTVVVWATAAPGLDATAMAAAASAAVAKYISTYPIGGRATDSFQGLFAAGVSGAIEETNAAIFTVTGLTDLALAIGQVAEDAIPSLTVRLVTP